MPLLRSGRLTFSHLYTLRAGELVWDNIAGELRITAEELVKVKEKGNKEGCLFYDGEENACRIYAHRPVQCATLNCRDPREFLRVHGGPKITRREVVEDRILLGLIEEHENRCSYRMIEGHVERIQREGEKAVGKLLELLRFDTTLRPFVSEKLGLDSGAMDFLFGRPLLKTVTMFGLMVERQADGSFFLTANASN
jgi:Fe-S-cluster containining protein